MLLLIEGMFDAYLGAQHELGSAADTTARLHFNAAMAMQASKVAVVVFFFLGQFFTTTETSKQFF